MRTFVVAIYDGIEKPIVDRRGDFHSMDEAVAALAQPGLIRVGNPADLRAVAREEGSDHASTEVSFYRADFVGADSE